MSPALRNFCYDKRNCVTVIKGLCKAIKLGNHLSILLHWSCSWQQNCRGGTGFINHPIMSLRIFNFFNISVCFSWMPYALISLCCFLFRFEFVYYQETSGTKSRPSGWNPTPGIASDKIAFSLELLAALWICEKEDNLLGFYYK